MTDARIAVLVAGSTNPPGAFDWAGTGVASIATIQTAATETAGRQLTEKEMTGHWKGRALLIGALRLGGVSSPR
jgi:hypothetical protein